MKALLLVLALLVASLVFTHETTAAPEPTDQHYTVEQLTPRILVIRGRGANTTVFRTDQTAVVVDPKHHGDRDLLRKKLDELGCRKVRWSIATSHRLEHSGALSALEGATTIAHERIDARLRQEGRDASELTFETAVTLQVGDEKITCRHKAVGCTDGDSLVYFHDQQVLVLGGLVVKGCNPIIAPEHGGDVRSWLMVLRELRKDFKGASQLCVVPAFGPSGGLELLQQQIDYLQDLVDAMDDAHRRGLSLDEALDGAGPLRARYGRLGVEQLERNLRAVYRETGR
jgi:glyoxylase-like metal-dependent hydrolase (beta-lactamase superfamily II)